MSDEFFHEPVLAREVVEALRPGPGRLFLDGTLGGGGHSGLLLAEGARVIALDKDPRALASATARLARFGEAFRAVRPTSATPGTCWPRWASPPWTARWWTWASPRPSSTTPPAASPSRAPDRSTCAWERRARRWPASCAASTCASWSGSCATTARSPSPGRWPGPSRRPSSRTSRSTRRRLAEIVSGAIPRRAWPKRIHPATRTFQALRIAVNDELGALAAWLDGLPSLLDAGGRAAAISFHSLEDRMVKERFRALTQACTCPPDLPVCACGAKAGFAAVTRKAVKASEEEIARNPRSRSARLRAVEKLR